MKCCCCYSSHFESVSVIRCHVVCKCGSQFLGFLEEECKDVNKMDIAKTDVSVYSIYHIGMDVGVVSTILAQRNIFVQF